MATITDVCKFTGLSKATVSRVINASGQVKESTREKVLSAMKTLNYHPSSVAQALATNVSNSIGLILPQFQSNYFGSILCEAEQCAQQANKKLLVVSSKNSAIGEQEALSTLAMQRCDAILLYSRHLTPAELHDCQNDLGVPLIILNRQLTLSNVHSFGLEQGQLAAIAMQHLLELGHQSIACISSPLASETGKLRYHAYLEALKQASLPAYQEWFAEGENTLETGYQAAKKLLSSGRPFSAIFACNDDMALGAIRALHDAGYAVPQDISVIGIDNEPAAAYAMPSLSSVSLPISVLTHDAMLVAIHHSTKQPTAIIHKTYPGVLVSRESTLQVS